MKKIESNEMFEEILKENKLVLTYYSRLWCGVCHAMKPQVESLQEGYPEVTLVEVNVDDTPDLGAQYTIFSVPAFILFYEGKEFMRQAGYLRLEQLQDVLERFKKIGL